MELDDDGALLTPEDVGPELTALDHALTALFEPGRFLSLLRDYVAFDSGDGGLTKRIVKPHQYFAVAKAVGSALEAVRSHGRAPTAASGSPRCSTRTSLPSTTWSPPEK